MMSRKKLALAKMFMSRTASYLAIINAGMILFLVLSKLEDYGIDIEIEKYFFLILFLGLIVLTLFGWLDDRLGFHQLERKHVEKRNPYMKDILERLDRIEKKIK
jgi:UDP-N-acetylmuramyl pentapeptide phosphotransferase/UDP-N-acetylglucosamine-1-phosphate transferase